MRSDSAYPGMAGDSEMAVVRLRELPSRLSRLQSAMARVGRARGGYGGVWCRVATAVDCGGLQVTAARTARAPDRAPHCEYECLSARVALHSELSRAQQLPELAEWF